MTSGSRRFLIIFYVGSIDKVTAVCFVREVHSYFITVCVCVFSSHSFWTSSSLDVPAGVTQEEDHTEFLLLLPSAVRALIFSREGFSHPFPRRP